MVSLTYKTSKTTDFFYKICFIAYILGFPNFWFEELKLSKRFIKAYNYINVINNLLIFLFSSCEVGAFFTQDNLTNNQRLRLSVFAVSKFVCCFYVFILMYYKNMVRVVLTNLSVNLKSMHNDPVVERKMIKKSLKYLIAVGSNFFISMIILNLDACLETMRNNVPFTTIITAYPNVYDNSICANIARAITNLYWWIFITRVMGTYMIVTPLTSGLSYQYRNLCTYFCSLSDITERQDLSQEEREDLYEEHFKLGIKMHLDTLRCTRQIHSICSGVFSGQIVLNVSLLVILMAQMVQSDRNLTNLLGTLSILIAVLITTGLFMWSAGDITVEASHLPTAIYFSGWHNCRGQSSVRVRKLVSITMTFAQRPVILKGFGYIGLSYQSYVNIVKSSYSVFSVLF